MNIVSVFRWALWAFIPLQLLMIYCAVSYIGSHSSIHLLDQVSLILSSGLIAGAFGITISHELLHSKSSFDRWLAWVQLTSINYTHLLIQHVQGHHVWAATPNDPASARLGQTLYEFLPRSLIYGYLDAWKHESKRVNRFKSPNHLRQNKMVRHTGSMIACNLLVLYFCGVGAWVSFALIGLIASSSLEITNYAQHYGLERKKLGPDKYEPMTPHFAWHYFGPISKYMQMNMQRHGDHHSHPSKPYQSLSHIEGVPESPFSNPIMFVIAFFPPVWFSLMNDRVLEYRTSRDQRSGKGVLATES